MADLTKILLVDDEPDITEFIGYNLKKEGYQVNTAENGLEAIKKAKTFKPDLIVMDVMMPEMDGIEACNEIKQIPELSEVFVLFLTARGEDFSQMAGFDAGADDYVVKPIKPKLLIKRIDALMRRKGGNTEQDHQENTTTIKVDRNRYVAIIDEKETNLPKKEFELLALLLSSPGSVFTRETILNNVWGEEVVVGDRTIDVHIRKLREKIGDQYIKTVKGVGYKYEEK